MRKPVGDTFASGASTYLARQNWRSAFSRHVTPNNAHNDASTRGSASTDREIGISVNDDTNQRVDTVTVNERVLNPTTHLRSPGHLRTSSRSGEY
jgi:hypothetical protein